MKIKRITITDTFIPMCDITVQDAHCYAYNGIIVHNSNKQKAEALLKMGIDTEVVSEKSKQMKLDKDALETLAKKYEKEVKEYLSKPEFYDSQFEKEKSQKGGIKRIPYEVIAWLLERSTLRKQLSSYTEKLSKLDTAFINYKLFDTQTGRLSSGGSGNEYFMNLNYQNLTKPKPAIYRAIHKTHPLYDTEAFKDIEDILDYKFQEVKDFIEGKPQPLFDSEGNVIEDTDYFVESTKKELNIRSAITVPNKDEWVFCVDKNSTYVELESGDKILIKYLEELIELNPELKIKTPYGYYTVLNYFDTGKKKKCVLKLKDGRTITCSSEHQFKVRTLNNDEYWKKLKDIIPSDIILDF